MSKRHERPTEERRVSLPPITRAAPVASVDEDSRSAEVVWTTGARVMRASWLDGKFEEELVVSQNAVRMDRLNGGAPVLNSHGAWDLRNVVGVVERAWIKGGEGRATIRFSERDDAEEIWRDVRAGIIRNVSVGYRIHRVEIEERDGQVPLYRVTDWEPLEVSLVAVGADAGAGVRSAPGEEAEAVFIRAAGSQDGKEADVADKTKGTPAPETTPADDKTRTDDAAAGKETRKAEKPTDNGPDLDAARDEATRAERERAAGIRKAAKAARVGDEFAQRLIDEGVSLDQARAKIIDHLAENEPADTRSGVRVEGIEDERDKWLRGASNAILVRAGVASLVQKQTKETIEPGEFRGLTMLDLAREALEMNGIKTRGMSKMDLMGKALTIRGAGVYQTTGDFSVLLENTMHKVLMAAYESTPDTWSRFCATGSVSDFRPHNRYKMGMFSRLSTLTEAGEFQNKPISDAEKEVIQASTYGNIISLSRQSLISDDLGAFNRLATMLGRAARLSIEVDVYGLFALNSGNGPTMNDGTVLFHADHNNIASSAGAPSVATFENVRTTMASQRDPWDNDYLDIRPSVWVGPIGLGGDARVVNDAQYDPDTANKLQKPNKVRGLFNDIVDTPRLSGTAWYAFADPSQMPAFEVAFLDGQTTPFLESEDGWRTDGVEWKVRLDYGVAAVDFRGVVKNAGA